MPTIATGTSGTFASSAIRAAPVCARASYFFRSPFLRLVPSGNMTTMCPSRQSWVAVSIASRSACPRRTGNAPAATAMYLNGIQKSSDFPMKRR